jgi:hypothetical protein
MAVTGMFKTYFVVWTTRGIFVELIKYDLEFWTRLLHNLEIFFKSYMVKVLLHIKSIFFCSLCDKVIFESEELTPESDENSVCCACVEDGLISNAVMYKTLVTLKSGYVNFV